MVWRILGVIYECALGISATIRWWAHPAATLRKILVSWSGGLDHIGLARNCGYRASTGHRAKAGNVGNNQGNGSAGAISSVCIP